MQLHAHDLSGGLFSGSGRVALADTPTDPRLIVNAPLLKTAKILDHAMTWQEAIVESGLDFGVQKFPIAFRDPESGGYRRISDVYATVRTDTNQPLGVVKGRYALVQNRDAGDTLDVLLDDGSAKIVAAGPFANGAICFVVAKIPADVLIGGESVQSFFVITWSHDGTYPVTVAIRMLRPACANTFPPMVFSREGTAKAAQRFVIRHVGDTALKVQQAREALQIGFAQAADFAAIGESMLKSRMTVDDVRAMTVELIPNPKGADQEVASRTQNRRDAIVGLFEHADNLADVRGTAWAAYNAVAEYADHVMPARNTKQTPDYENRARSVLFGAADRLKRQAFVSITNRYLSA